MINIKWHFNEHRPGDKIREAVQGEFFSVDALTGCCDALIREAFQNSLDARDTDKKLFIRIQIKNRNHALDANKTQKYFQAFEPHLNASKSEILELPVLNQTCPYLVIEDFGTTGLTGNPNQWKPERKVRNNFFYFFRAEGRSDKKESSRGRWGLGKYVFPNSSKISSFFAYTIRNDDNKKLLMGQSILKFHQIQDKFFLPDGWFGNIHNFQNGKIILPLENTDSLDEFTEDFCITRKDEPGLSLVIPFYHENEINYDNILYSILKNYFWPILSKQLEVELISNSKSILLNEDNFHSVLKKILKRSSSEIDEFSNYINIATWARTQTSELFTLNFPKKDRALKWDESLIPHEKLKQMQHLYYSGENISIKIPFFIRKKNSNIPCSTNISLYLFKKSNSQGGKPLFIRGGIIIPDVRSNRIKETYSLVLADDPVICELLGDAENPAHTQWNNDSQHFKGKYVFGPSIIKFVSDSCKNIISILSSTNQIKDRWILRNFFSLKLPEEEKTTTGKSNKKIQNLDDDTLDIEFNKYSMKISRIENGFYLKPESNFELFDKLYTISVCYQTRYGNPFKKYQFEDFQLNKEPIIIESEGVSIISVYDNWITFKIFEENFKLIIKGFDSNRNLKVKIE